MNGFDSYRVRERADVARWVLVGRVPRPLGRVLPHPDHPARQVPAQGGNQPPPPDRAHAAPRRHPRPARPDHRRERPRIFGEAARAEPRLAARGAGPRGPLRATRHLGAEEILRRYAAARYQPVVVLRRRDVRDRRPPGGASGRAAGAGDPVGAEAPVSRRQGGGAPGGLRLGGHRVRPDREPVSRRRTGLDRGQGGTRARVRRYAPRRRGRALHRSERPRPPGARGSERARSRRPRASRSARRSISISSASSTASGRPAPAARWSR